MGSRRTGIPDYLLTQRYPPHVEDLFTVVWWDQRGAALPYHSGIPPESMTIERFIDDTLAVTDYLQAHFTQDTIHLLGHSWGSFLALQAAARAPERYRAYLGMGQMAHQLESEKIAYDYMLEAYRRRGDTDMVPALEACPRHPGRRHPRGVPEAARHRHAQALCGDDPRHEVGDLLHLLTSLWFRGYTTAEKVRLWRGRAFSRSFGFWDTFTRVDLRQTVPTLRIPAYFFEGRYDYTCVTSLARDYHRRLQAPVKGSTSSTTQPTARCWRSRMRPTASSSATSRTASPRSRTRN